MTSSQSSIYPLRRRRLGEWALLALCLVMFFMRLGSISLFDLDEALYVGCSKQMVLSGDWVTPRLNSRPPDQPQRRVVPFYEKPILVYWLCAASLKAFGINELAARLPVALLSLLTTFTVFLAGKRWFDRRSALFAAAVYATAPMTIADARQVTTDALLVCWFAVAMIAFWNVVRERAADGSPSSREKQHLFVFWTTCAVAVLTKGAVGLLLPFMVIGVHLALKESPTADKQSNKPAAKRLWPGLNSFRDILRGCLSLRPILGMLLVLIVIAPWHLAILQTHEFDALHHTWFQEYIMRQHIGRFRGLDKVHNSPIFMYIPYFLIGFFPWSCFAPAAFRWKRGLTEVGSTEDKPADSTDHSVVQTPDAAQRSSRTTAAAMHQAPAASGDASTHRFLLIWFWTIFLFFSISAAKLPTYIVPAYPAAALLVGRWLARQWERITEPKTLQRGAAGAAITAGILTLAAVALAFAPQFVDRLATRYVPRHAAGTNLVPGPVATVLLHLMLAMLVFSLAAWIAFRFRPQSSGRFGIAALFLMMVGLVGVGVTEGYAAAERYVLGPYQQTAIDARADADRGISVVFYRIEPRLPSMLYYGGYSPVEQKDPPLLPWLNRVLTPASPTVDMVTKWDVYTKEIQPLLALHPEISAAVLTRHGEESRGGWVLLRIAYSP